MTIYQILKQIKKLKVKDLCILAEKLEAIEQKHREQLSKDFNSKYLILEPVIDMNDIEDALAHCIFHFKGGMLESFGLEECPCKCYCISCEMIPEHPIGIEMQNIAENMTEKNVFDEYLERTTNGQSSRPCNSDNSIADSGCK